MAIRKVEKKEEKKNYFEMAKELYLINQQRSALEKREKALKLEMSEVMKSQPKDTKQNSYLAFKTVDGKDYFVKYEARQSMCLNSDRAKEFLREKGFLDRVMKQEVREYLDESEIEALVANGDIQFEDFETLIDKNTTFALKFVAKKEEVTEDANKS